MHLNLSTAIVGLNTLLVDAFLIFEYSFCILSPEEPLADQKGRTIERLSWTMFRARWEYFSFRILILG